jgi:hypothetical protein
MPSLVEKQKAYRDELDEILTEYGVPKEYWHVMDWLNCSIGNFIMTGDMIFNNHHKRKFERALQLIHALSPRNLTRLYPNIKYDID